jgi:polyhydroxybutyrate depolymerase
MAFPNGFPGDTTDNYWAAEHCCERPLTCEVDDVGFAQDLVAELSSSLSIDPLRVHATGFSNGGMLVHKIAADVPDLFDAVAVSGTTVGGRPDESAPLAQIEPGAPVPILMLHGTDDASVRVDGGEGNYGRIDLPLAESAAVWAETNGCDSTPVTSEEPNGALAATVHTYTNCEADVEVVLIEGLGHRWPEQVATEGYDGDRAVFDFLTAHPGG